MRALFITLNSDKTITIESNKQVFEFNSLLELKDSGILSMPKLIKLINQILKARENEILDFKFKL